MISMRDDAFQSSGSLAALRGLARSIAANVGLAPGKRPDPARILLGLTMPIGDTLFCQPAIAGIRRRFPQARLTALVWETTQELAQANPDIDDIILYHPDPALDFISRLDRTLCEMYARRFQLMVNFSASSNCVGILSGIPRQVWQRLPWGFWLWGSAFAPEYGDQHAVDHYWNVVADLGITPRSPAERIPRWQVSVAERQAAHARLAGLGIFPAPTLPVVMLHPGAAGFGGRKRWPADRFGALAARLINEHDARVVVLGGPQDVESAAAIVAATAGRAVSLAGQLTLSESIAMLTGATVYIGGDTGLTHFAAALAVPTVALYGVSDLVQFAPRPLDPRRLRLLLPRPLPPPAGFFIGTEGGPFAPHHPPDDRMEHISVERVLTATVSLLAREQHHAEAPAVPLRTAPADALD